MRTDFFRSEALHQRRPFATWLAIRFQTARTLHHELTTIEIVIELHSLVAVRHLHLRLLTLLEHGVAHGTAHRTPSVLARLMMLQQLTRRQASRIVALRQRALQHVLPQLLRDVTVRRVGAVPVSRLTLARVSKEEKPSLLFHDVRLS